MENNLPDYKTIYLDILHKKFPQKIKECSSLLQKELLSTMDIIELNKRIFGPADKETQSENQKHRSYHESDIFDILDYQKKHKLTNIETARHFKTSRNTIAKWKKIYVTKVKSEG